MQNEFEEIHDVGASGEVQRSGQNVVPSEI
jgi:hypothetical protein